MNKKHILSVLYKAHNLVDGQIKVNSKTVIKYDSLDLVMFLMEIEQTLKIQIDDDLANNWENKTFSQIADEVLIIFLKFAHDTN